MKARIRIHGFLIFFGVCLMLAFPRFVFPTGESGPQNEMVDLLGVFSIFIGYILRIASRGHKIEHSAVGGNLVQDGPYAFVRNPMYLGTLFIGSGIVLALFRPWLFVLFLAVFSGVFLREMKKEKVILTQKFGGSYDDYCRRVPSLFPSMSKLLHVKEYIFVKSVWVKRELASFGPVMIMVLGVDAFQDSRQFSAFDIRREFLGAIVVFVVFFILVKFFTRE